MKYFYTLLLSIFSLYSSTAQTAITFPDSNAVWVTGTYHYDGVDVYQIYTIAYCMGKEDTTIGSYTYSKINYCGGSYKGATRTQDHKVYYIPKDSTEDYLLYDFSVEEGAQIIDLYVERGDPYIFHDPITIDHVSEIMIDGVAHKEITFGGARWIEGIGNSYGLFASIETQHSEYYTKLDCMSRNDSTLYPNFSLQGCNLTLSTDQTQKAQTLLLFPNPTQHRVTLQWEESWTDVTIQVFNASGTSLEPRISHSSTAQAEIDLSGYPEGMYNIVVNTAKENYSVKLVKQ